MSQFDRADEVDRGLVPYHLLEAESMTRHVLLNWPQEQGLEGRAKLEQLHSRAVDTTTEFWAGRLDQADQVLSDWQISMIRYLGAVPNSREILLRAYDQWREVCDAERAVAFERLRLMASEGCPWAQESLAPLRPCDIGSQLRRLFAKYGVDEP